MKYVLRLFLCWWPWFLTVIFPRGYWILKFPTGLVRYEIRTLSKSQTCENKWECNYSSVDMSASQSGTNWIYLITLGFTWRTHGLSFSFYALVEIQNNSTRPMELYLERPRDFMPEIPAWANHCDSCCDLETQWTCWRPDYPRNPPKWPLYWSLIVSSGGSEHNPGRTEKD